ncbi:MAG: CHAT domain-containing protein [Armatimonadetes bacterium]|nr:CHAT domain-containing protein [Armatimonadota bacterium]
MGIEAAKLDVNRGIGLLHMRRCEQARDLFARALPWFMRDGDPYAQAFVQNNLAAALTRLGQLDEALTLLKLAYDTFGCMGQDLNAAKVQGNIGYLYYVRGAYADAVAALRKTRHSIQHPERPETKVHHEEALAHCDADLGDIQREANLREEALVSYNSAIQRYTSLNLPVLRARAQVNRARLLADMGRSADADRALTDADAVFIEHNAHELRGMVQLVRAFVAWSHGDAEIAVASANDAVRLLSDLGQRAWRAYARYILADLELRQGRNAVRQMARAATDARRLGQHALRSAAQLAIGEYHERRGESAQALSRYRKAVDALEHARSLMPVEYMNVAFVGGDRIDSYEKLVGALLRRNRSHDLAEALQVLEKSRSRLLLERIRANQFSSVPSDKEEVSPHELELREVRARISHIHYGLTGIDTGDRAVTPGHDANPGPSLRALEARHAELLLDIDLGVGAGSRSGAELDPAGRRLTAELPTPERIQAAIAADETLVEFFSYDGKYRALVIDRSGIRASRPLASVADVALMARRLRFELIRAMARDATYRRLESMFVEQAEHVLQELYDGLLRALEPMIDGKKLTIVPHRELNGLPFHAMLDETTAAGERWEVAYAPAAAIWLATKDEGADSREFVDRPLLLAPHTPDLEYPEEEVKAIAAILGDAKAVVGLECTRAKFPALAAGRRIVHMASHGRFNRGNALLSSIEFPDDDLMVVDLYKMRLNCDLVTLSACLTGASAVAGLDEAMGMVRGFIAAGVRTLVVSYWQVDDEGTTALMERFYTHLVAGMTKAAALQAAQRDMRETRPHPFFWGAFALVGGR